MIRAPASILKKNVVFFVKFSGCDLLDMKLYIVLKQIVHKKKVFYDVLMRKYFIILLSKFREYEWILSKLMELRYEANHIIPLMKIFGQDRASDFAFFADI